MVSEVLDDPEAQDYKELGLEGRELGLDGMEQGLDGKELG